MMQKNINEQQLKEILELAQKAEEKAKAMCELIIEHSVKYKRWYEEAQIKKDANQIITNKNKK